MTQKYNGRVQYANGRPMANVRVKLFDRDVGGKDDNLTVKEGVSSTDGRFTVHYQPERDLNFTDIYLPYLRFDYEIKGRVRQHHAFIQPFTTTFKLPELPPVTFKPVEHGFQFINSFQGFWIPYSIPSIPDIPVADTYYGLCGGMIAAAYDFILAGRQIPKRKRRPGRASPLHQYIHQRQVDSLGVWGNQVVRFARWMVLSDKAVQRRTFQEFAKLKKILDQGNPSPIGLVYMGAVQIWKNHQVLACGYEESAAGIKIQIYDPNYPRRTRRQSDITIDCQKSGGSRLICEQKIPNRPDKHVRGFFVMPYEPITPPDNLTVDT